MEWKPKIVLPIVGCGVLLGTAVVVGILRLGGLVDWPARWVVFTLFGLLVVPIAVLLASAANEAARQSGDWDSPGWWPDWLP